MLFSVAMLRLNLAVLSMTENGLEIFKFDGRLFYPQMNNFYPLLGILCTVVIRAGAHQ